MKCPYCDIEPEYGMSSFDINDRYAPSYLKCQNCDSDFTELKIAVQTNNGKDGFISFADLIFQIKFSILR